jgi:hypothetical protein
MKIEKSKIISVGGIICGNEIHFHDQEVSWLDGSVTSVTVVFSFSETGKDVVEVCEYGNVIVHDDQTSLNSEGEEVEFMDCEYIDGGDIVMIQNT